MGARRQLLLGVATAAVGITGHGRGAYADCVFTGAGTYVCSGFTTTTQSRGNVGSATVVTTGDFSAAVPGDAIRLDFTDAVEFDDLGNANNISADGDGITARGKYGGVSITTSGDITAGGDGIVAYSPYGNVSVSVTAGTVSGADKYGVEVDVSNSGSTGTVTVASGAEVNGGKYGILLSGRGAGSVTIDEGGRVVGGIREGERGPFTSKYEADATVTVNGDVDGDISFASETKYYGPPRTITLDRSEDRLYLGPTGSVSGYVFGASLVAGSGRVGAIVSDGDGVTIAPGSGATGDGIGTLTVTGDVVLSGPSEIGGYSVGGGKYRAAETTPGDIVDIQISSDGSTSDRIAVGGTAYIEGATLRVSSPDALEDFPADGEYVVIDAEGGVDGTFAAVEDEIPDLALLVSYTETEVVLSYALDVDNLTEKAGIGATAFAAGQTSRLFQTVLQMHAMPGVLGFGPAEARASSAGMVDLPAPMRAAAQDVSVFADVIGGRTDVEDDGDLIGYDSDSLGAMLGVRSAVPMGAGSLQFGAALGYVETDVDAGITDGEVEAVHLGLFAGYTAGPLSIGGGLTYGDLDIETTRDLGAFAGEGSTDGRTRSAQIEVSYDVAQRFGLTGSSIAPYLGAEVVHTSWGGFEEDGSTLAVEGGGTTTRFLRAGVRYSGTASAGGMLLHPSLSLGYEHADGDLAATTVSNVGIGGDLFDTSASIDRDRVTLGAGLGIGSGAVRGHVGYRGVFGDSSDEQSATLGVSVRF